MAEAVLFSQMEPPPELEAEFNNWYDHEHVPLRLAIDGFTGARRYEAVDADIRYAVVYYMTSVDVLETPGYRRIKDEPSDRTRRMLGSVRALTRFIAEEIGRSLRPGAQSDVLAAPYLFAVMFAVPGDRRDEFEAWYEEDHVPILLRNRHWREVRRYRIVSGEPQRWTHLTLHYLDDLSALDSEERRAARDTEWRRRLATEPWFRGYYAVYRRRPAGGEEAQGV